MSLAGSGIAFGGFKVAGWSSGKASLPKIYFCRPRPQAMTQKYLGRSWIQQSFLPYNAERQSVANDRERRTHANGVIKREITRRCKVSIFQ